MLAGLSLAVVGGMTSCKKEGCTDSTATDYDEPANSARRRFLCCSNSSCHSSSQYQGAETLTGMISADALLGLA